MPGYNAKIINAETGEECPAGVQGTIFLKAPLPPSFMLSILSGDDIYKNKYFSTLEGYYDTGDAGFRDEEGYCYIMSRTDDVINTAGHRLSTG